MQEARERANNDFFQQVLELLKLRVNAQLTDPGMTNAPQPAKTNESKKNCASIMLVSAAQIKF